MISLTNWLHSNKSYKTRCCFHTLYDVCLLFVFVFHFRISIFLTYMQTVLWYNIGNRSGNVANRREAKAVTPTRDLKEKRKQEENCFNFHMNCFRNCELYLFLYWFCLSHIREEMGNALQLRHVSYSPVFFGEI